MNCVLHLPLFQRLVQLWFGEGRRPGRSPPSQSLLAFNLRQQQFLLTLGAMDVAWPQLGDQAVLHG